MNRKGVISVLVVIVFAAVACSRSQQGQTQYPTVRIAQWVWPSLNVLSQGSGIDKEEFDKLGTSATYTYVDSGAALQAAIAGGQIDIGLVGGARFVTMLAAGLPIKLIWIPDTIDSAEGLVVKKGIKSVAELKGKRVATPFASISHYGLLAVLDLYGVDKAQVKIIDLNPPDTVAAFQRGDVDAVFVWDPHFSKIADELGGTKLLTLGDLNRATNGKRAAMDVIFVRNAFMERYPALVEAYVRALDRATQLYQSDPNKAAEAMKTLMGLESADEVKRQASGLTFANAKEHLDRNWDRVGADVFYSIGEFLRKQGQLETTPSRDEIVAAIDFSFIRRVAK